MVVEEMGWVKVAKKLITQTVNQLGELWHTNIQLRKVIVTFTFYHHDKLDITIAKVV